VAWHDRYDDPDSALSHRLAVVRRRIGEALDGARRGSITVMSMCAGQGRDLLGALDAHPRRDDVRARLVELDEDNVRFARASARAAGLDENKIEIVRGDASDTSAYEGMVPADLVLACGVFGNVPDDDIRNTIELLPALCAPGATVIWTRGRRAPDVTPSIRSWFADAGFDEVAFDVEAGFEFSVGTHRYTGDTKPFVPGVHLFTFVEPG
jgi:predicted O-methyltransferase YrrM